MAEIPIVFILAGLAAYTVLAGADFGAGRGRCWLATIVLVPSLVLLSALSSAAASTLHPPPTRPPSPRRTAHGKDKPTCSQPLLRPPFLAALA